MKFKGTKGELEMKFMQGGICIGIGTVGDYCQITANSILPESDEEYAKEKEELEANMRLYATAPNLLNACKNAIKELELINGSKEIAVLELEKAIEKALK